jgi:hypothetical protein
MRLMNVFISHPFHTFPVCPWKDMRLVRCVREEKTLNLTVNCLMEPG